MMENLLEIKNLNVYFCLENRVARVLEGVSLEIKSGEVLALVGESGCGKTVLGLSILKLVPPPGRIVGGEIIFAGKDLLGLSEREIQNLRGKEIAMVFQEPLTSLNPVLSIGYQMREMFIFHLKISKKEAQQRAEELLSRVGFSQPEVILESYPHQLSGGMRQRAMLAMNLSGNPKFLILDEPTTALDTTIQAQILELILKIKKEMRLTALFITHDLAIVKEIADKVAIMYLGKIVEIGKTAEIFQNPFHPYTQRLFACLLELNEPRTLLKTIPGQVPQAINRPSGCPFHPRCERKLEVCIEEFPPETKITESHLVWCHNPGFRK
ncbi:MAG: ABC transporter ATP-binding protein [Candidatus Omnitrophica bacterium]|nr:ABC transporter ATP-binding protein [Candidatus Omnitrophota bacterium]MCM8792941.1 ABC transporter ATP-binding protein [Candidatus Omnitrophota bacterium]